MQELLKTPGVMIAAISAITAGITTLSQYFINYRPNKKIEKLGKDVKNINNKLEEQSAVVSCYAAEKSVTARLGGVRNHAVSYAVHQWQKDAILGLSRLILSVSSDIIKMGLDSVPDEVIKAGMSRLSNDIISILTESGSSSITEDTVKIIATQVLIYGECLRHIKKDDVNNKTARVINKTEDLLQEISRVLISVRE